MSQVPVKEYNSIGRANEHTVEIVLAYVEAAPSVDNILPSNAPPAPIEIAPLFAIIVPFMIVPAAKAMAPSATQKILQVCVTLTESMPIPVLRNFRGQSNIPTGA